MKINGDRVRHFRVEGLLTQKELADIAGITESTLSRIESGKQAPRISTVRKLVKALGVSVDDILKEDQ